jgi:DNA-binding response OmpR family regulator
LKTKKKVAQFIKQGLEELGYEVDLAHDGLLGRKKAEDKRYDLIVLDLLFAGLEWH